MEQRITLITLGVSDLETAADFYQTKFGWTKSKSSNENIVFFQLNGILLSLFSKEALAEDAHTHPDGSGFKSFTLAYNAHSEQEVDHLMQDLKDKGVKVVKEAQKVFWGGYSGYIADPEGNLWEIAYNPFLPLDEKGNVIPQE